LNRPSTPGGFFFLTPVPGMVPTSFRFPLLPPCPHLLKLLFLPQLTFSSPFLLLACAAPLKAYQPHILHCAYGNFVLSDRFFRISSFPNLGPPPPPPFFRHFSFIPKVQRKPFRPPSPKRAPNSGTFVLFSSPVQSCLFFTSLFFPHWVRPTPAPHFFLIQTQLLLHAGQFLPSDLALVAVFPVVVPCCFTFSFRLPPSSFFFSSRSFRPWPGFTGFGFSTFNFYF